MSVVGIDVGNDTSCVALARKRGIDVLMNKESKRETPAVINFGDKMRFLGTDGYGKLGLAPQNTVHQLKRLLGKKFADPAVQADAARLPFAISEGPDGGVLIHVTYCNEQATFTPEQVMAMVLVDLKHIVEAEAGLSVTDCVLSVPTFFTETERYAMLNSSQIAGLNCLRLINENTATALAYGIFKTDLPEAEAVNVVFVDVGHAATQVSVVSLKKSSLQVRAHAWDRDLGGRDFDEVLFEHFAAEFQAKTKRDIRGIKKAAFKLRVGVEKLKKILSANAEAPLNIECLVEDDDLRGMMTRDKFEELAAPVLAQLKAPMEKALADSGLSVADISSVEIVGSSTRMPAIFRAVEDVFKKPPSRTMNSKECVCRGAALQCAMLSPVFKVREFEVIDACPFTVNVSWEKDGTTISQALFKRNDAFPSTKVITFSRSQPFDVAASYSEDSDIPAAMDSTIGVYHVGPFTVPPGADAVKLKAKIRMNLHGLVSVESVQAQEEVEVAEAPKDVPMAEASAAPADGAAPAAAAAPEADASGPVPMETEASKAAAAAAKKKVKKTDVAFSASKVAGYEQKAVDRYFEQECQMQAADRLQEETNERKNALEGYVYDLRNKLSDAYAPFIKESDKEALTAELQSLEDWLYEEGEDTTKSVYTAKLEELKAKGAPVEQRFSEAQTRAPAAEALKAAAQGWIEWGSTQNPQYAHISLDDKAKVVGEGESALKWLHEKLALQAQQPKHEPPVLLTADIIKKKEAMDRLARPIMATPPPPPPAAPAPPPQPAPPAPAAEAEAAPMETDAQGTPAKAADEPMQD